MEVTVSGFLGGCPQFCPPEVPLVGRSLFTENRSINHLKPTSYSANKILLFIQRIVQRILNWLYPFERTNYAGIVAALDRNAEDGFGALSPEETLRYFKKFFTEEEGSSSLRGCVDQLREQYEAIGKLHDAARKEIPDAEKQKLKAPLDRWIQRTVNLKEGEQSLILASDERGDELFYLFSKRGGELSFQIIGRGPSMIRLSGVEEVAVAGQAKLVSCLNYGAVDGEFVHEVLKYSPLGETVEAPGFAQILQGKQARAEDFAQHLETKTTEVFSVFWTALKGVDRNRGSTEAQCDRSKIRLEIFTLFSLFKEYRLTLGPSVDAVVRMFRICSQSLMEAHQKGIISRDEVEAFVKELAIVQQAIDEASMSGQMPIADLKMLSMEMVPPQAMSSLVTAAEVVLPAAHAIAHPRYPRLAPPNGVGAEQRVAIQRPLKLDPQMPIVARLEALVQQEASPQRIVQAIYEMDFSPYEKWGIESRYVPKLDAASDWVQCSPEMAKEIMGHLNILSRRLVAFSVQEGNELPIDMYEILVKMSGMVAFLSHHILHQGQFSDDSYRLIEQVLFFQSKVAFPSCITYVRTGHCIHSANVRTNLQMLNFVHQMWELQRQYLPAQTHEFRERVSNRRESLQIMRGAPKGFEYLHEQVSCLLYLLPHHIHHLCIDDKGGLSSSIYSWIAPLPLPLLSVYHSVRMQTIHSASPYIRQGPYQYQRTYRDTPESIQHDPESVLSAFQPELRTGEMWLWRVRSEAELEQRDRIAEEDAEAARRGIPFAGHARAKQLRALLKKQEQYLLRAEQMGVSFSKEELTALLSLLRAERPQTEIIAFMETHASLLSHPVVRSWVQLLFFHPVLLETLNRGYYGSRHQFCQFMPRFLAQKIAASMAKVEMQPSEMETLLFFIQMSERLKGIYEVLRRDAPTIVEREKYDTDPFFALGDGELRRLLQQYREKDPASLASTEVTALQLKILFAQPTLSQRELCQIILDMQQLMKTADRACSFDYRELFWIKGSYQNLLQQLPGLLDQDHLHYVLDTLCHRSGLVLDDSPWRGEFPLFSNAQYRVNLQTGAITDLVSESIATPLPASLLVDPLYRKTFPELLGKEVRAMKVQADGVNVYFFRDLKKNQCRVEEREGGYTLYRSFAGHPEMLQAVELKKKEVVQAPEDQKPGFLALLKQLSQKQPPPLPALLQQRLFVDPKEPLKGYILSAQNEIELEVHLKQGKEGFQIESVVDLREENPSAPMQLVGLAAIQEGALQQLAQIENPAHILAWGKKGGKVEKIELPRYGLKFAIREGALLCISPKYAGYRVSLGASVRERKGFPFSLLLEHPDRTRPKKLLLPPAGSITSEPVPALPYYYGLAYLLWCIQALIAYLRFGALPRPNVSLHFQIESEKDSLHLTAIDLRPHTEEFHYREIEQSQELISQAVKLGDEELALGVLRSVQIVKEERELQKWIRFLSSFHEHGTAAAVGLKITEKLQETIRGQKKYNALHEKLRSIEEQLFTIYLQAAHKLAPPLRLEKATFDRIAASVERRYPDYYQRHVAPFFLKVGDPFTFLPEAGAMNLSELSSILAQQVLQEQSEIEKLEEEIRPEIPLDRGSLRKELTLLPQNTPLILEEASFARYFNGRTLTGASGLLEQVIRPRQEELQQERAQAKRALQELLSSSSESLEQLAIYAQEKQIASFSDLLLALLQRDFASLRDHLPSDIDLQKLEAAVIRFYDLEVKFHLISRCRDELERMSEDKATPAIWAAKSSALWDMLNYRREYAPEEHPELLSFEALHFVTFRNSMEPSQLALLQRLVQEPSSIIQAGTGTGKSSVLSVLRGFMRANGTNLVSQKVLPHLFQETVAILQSRLGHLKRKLYPCLFNQSMPLYDQEGNSLFAQIYCNLLETIRNKGCVLTDYKSFPLLEQKFLSVSKQLVTNQENGVASDPVLMTHWVYLRKILILLANRDDQLMDEFDQPLSAVQRIQTQMREGPLFESWKIEESLALYDLLQRDDELLLKGNLQGALPPEIRSESIKRVARQIARDRAREGATQERIYSYLIGESEEVLAYIDFWSPEEKDALAFLKEQCTVYLPLTLNRSSISHYARGKDGKKVTTCNKGERREAKFGNPIEEINYTIQDYLQQKIALPVFRAWLIESKQDWVSAPEPAEKRFADQLPNVSLAELAYLPPDDFEDRAVQLLQEANRRPETVLFFLKRHLRSLRTSGIVIPMNPQDSVAMSLVVSGVSATAGSLGSLHTQFEKDLDAAEELREKMVERLKQRSWGNPIRYNPLAPLEVLRQINNPRLCAIIDGSAAFQSIPPEEVARALLKTNPSLKRVEFYDKEGNVGFVGAREASLPEKGFYFPQAQTRGSDQLLNPDGLALMTADDKGDIEDFLQEEGRMRHPQQKVLVALSAFASSDLRTLEDLIARKEANRKAANQADRYPAELQRLRQIMRHAARKELLDISEFEPFSKRFKELESLFIQSISAEESSPGDYFRTHSRLVRRNADPVEQLQMFQRSLIDQCEQLKIPTETLRAYDASQLGPYMPDRVLPLNTAEEQQLEVQEELEVNNQFEIEQEQEQQQEQQVVPNKVEFYLPRGSTMGNVFPAAQLHKAFSPLIMLTHSYLPLDRVDPLHKRTPFDDRTPRIGSVLVVLDDRDNFDKIVIGDVLDDIDGSNCVLSFSCYGHDFLYDIRLGQVTSSLFSVTRIVRSPQFHSLIAQIKFLDGMTDGYSAEELESLGFWLQANGIEEMFRFFSNTILKHRPEQRFAHSQLWELFEKLGQSERINF